MAIIFDTDSKAAGLCAFVDASPSPFHACPGRPSGSEKEPVYISYRHCEIYYVATVFAVWVTTPASRWRSPKPASTTTNPSAPTLPVTFWPALGVESPEANHPPGLCPGSAQAALTVAITLLTWLREQQIDLGNGRHRRGWEETKVAHRGQEPPAPASTTNSLMACVLRASRGPRAGWLTRRAGCAVVTWVAAQGQLTAM